MRLIDADALSKRLQYLIRMRVYDIFDCLNEIDAAPTIEAEPVEHGRWEEHGYKWRCSSCGVLMSIDGTPKENLLNYCANCGAKMDLGEKNENSES